MFLKNLIDIEELTQLIKDGLVSARPHPRFPLTILNYTPAAASVQEWSNTLSYCRGLVYDTSDFTVVNIPMKKFWNYGDSKAAKLPVGLPRIYEKYDGSVLFLFFAYNEWICATRGSFESDQAKWAQKWVNSHLDYSKWDSRYSDGYNYIFEVIIPEDRKVVNYDFSGLVLLGSVRLESGVELSPEKTMLDLGLEWLPGIKIAKQYAYKDLEELQKENVENREGYVVVMYWDGPAIRVKLKFDLYCQLHRMIFQTTPVVLWELVRDNQDIRQKLEGADQTLIDWAIGIENDLKQKYYTIDFLTQLEHNRYSINYNLLTEKELRKDYAAYATKCSYPDLQFLLYDGRIEKYRERIWDTIKPKNSDYCFRKEEE